MEGISDFQSLVIHSAKTIYLLHRALHSGIRGKTVALLSLWGLCFFSTPCAAQIPAGLATAGPASHLELPPAVRVTTASDDVTANDMSAPAVAIPFRPTMDQTVFDLLKIEARATTVPNVLRVPSALSAPAVSLRLDKNFEGVNQSLAFGPGAGFSPPDTHGAISTTQFVEIVNTALVVYDRNTGGVLKRVSLNAFFGYPVPPGQFIFDPRVAYDRGQDRFVVTGVAFAEAPDVEFFFIGVSETNDATGAFFVQRINVRQPPFTLNALFDYPILGIGTDGVFVTSNIFAPGFVGADLVVFPKAPLYAGTDFTITVFTSLIGTLTPPIVLDGNLSSFLLANLPNTRFVAIFELTGAGDPTTTVLADPFIIDVGPYLIPRSARQPGTTATLDTLDTRFQNASTQRGTSLFNVHTINFSTFPTPRWYELNLAAHAVVQSGLFFGTETSDDWNPSIVASDSNDVFVTWSSSNVGAREGNPPYFPQVRASGRLSTDPSGVISPGVAVFESTVPYLNLRWGDYSAVTLDPNNASCAWGVNEKVNASFVWGSRFFNSCLQ